MFMKFERNDITCEYLYYNFRNILLMDSTPVICFYINIKHILYNIYYIYYILYNMYNIYLYKLQYII